MNSNWIFDLWHNWIWHLKSLQKVISSFLPIQKLAITARRIQQHPGWQIRNVYLKTTVGNWGCVKFWRPFPCTQIHQGGESYTPSDPKAFEANPEWVSPLGWIPRFPSLYHNDLPQWALKSSIWVKKWAFSLHPAASLCNAASWGSTCLQGSHPAAVTRRQLLLIISLFGTLVKLFSCWPSASSWTTA